MTQISVFDAVLFRLHLLLQSVT